ncbi:hypothetical protein [Picrophilus oshimae]|uniref:hypothetical protein n=1 Tax=Picrophilus oshimae TaxID=46632 RepID=UPI000A048455|nr:hypothetical protein [Picrophilus oshimae]
MRRWFKNLKAKSILTATVALRNLGNRDLLILASLIKNQDTKKTYAKLSKNNNILLKGMSKSRFF